MLAGPNFYVVVTNSPELGPGIAGVERGLQERVRREMHLGNDFPCGAPSFCASLIIVAPHRGSIPNGIKYLRISNELWSSINIDFDVFFASDPTTQGRMAFEAVLASIRVAKHKKLSANAQISFLAAAERAFQKWCDIGCPPLAPSS